MGTFYAFALGPGGGGGDHLGAGPAEAWSVWVLGLRSWRTPGDLAGPSPVAGGGGGWEHNWDMTHLGVWPDAGPFWTSGLHHRE